MNYIVSYKNPLKRLIDIEFQIDKISTQEIYLQLPSWRPGRYELQNYSRNIQKFAVIDRNGRHLEHEKINKERWRVNTQNIDSIIVRYNYYAYQMDAGGCWLDEEQLYINFICCLLYAAGRETEPCSVDLKIDPNYKIACGLTLQGTRLQADNYYSLVDSPMIASSKLLHHAYQIDEYKFNIWSVGSTNLNWDFVKEEFKSFTKEQLETMGDFPEKEYHFLYQFLPYKQHHGVEHKNSTIITLGPGELTIHDPYYIDFLSISCHELFHAWNIIKIRPKELLPYDFTKENYFKSGFIVEGVTTYYGEYFLARAGVITQEQYFLELNLQLKKHFENNGNYNLSVADSSFDLWVDGYVGGIPNRKVSIYVKGAVIAFILDLSIREATYNRFSLDDVMVNLYQNFGKKNIGYTIIDFQNIVEEITKKDYKDFFNECVYGTTDLQERIEEALHYIGCQMDIMQNRLPLEKNFGLRVCIQKDGRTLVDATDTGSPADTFLTKDDEIIAINSLKVTGNANDLTGTKREIEIVYFRKNRIGKALLTASQATYFKQVRISKIEHPSDIQKENFFKWLKSPW